MNRPRPEKSAGTDKAVEDPAFISGALQALFETEQEFQIKVEGTSTLPYASVIKAIRTGEQAMVLKLVRPLPHELLPEAMFQMIFPVGEQRFEAIVSFRGREAYLQYRFDLPASLTYADRRRANRFPFRPRESAYVIAQDGRIPGLGVAGPLVNISMGGLALRVDRVLKLDDGMRVPPSCGLFEREKGFPTVRIQDLPRLPLLEWRGTVAHASYRGTEVILGLDFGELGEEEARKLGDCLEFREKVLRGVPHAPRAGGDASGSTLGSETGEVASLEEGASEMGEPLVALASGPGGDPLVRMQRRTARGILCMPEGEARDRVLERLNVTGFLRVEIAPDLQALRQRWVPPVPLLLVDLALAGAGDAEPLAAVRILERELGDSGPVAMLCEWVDPTLLLALGPRTHILPYAPTTPQDEREWVACLDALIGISRTPNASSPEPV